MAEQFLTLMGDLDDESQIRMAAMYDELKKAGFTGVQTPGLPFHISLATFPLDMEAEVVEHVMKVAASGKQVDVNISHMGVFAGGRVLFGAPDMNPELLALHDAVEMEGSIQEYGWTPHATFLLDEPEVIGQALPVLSQVFQPFLGKVVRLHLCAFWPTREILSVKLGAR